MWDLDDIKLALERFFDSGWWLAILLGGFLVAPIWDLFDGPNPRSSGGSGEPYSCISYRDTCQ